MRGAQRGQHDKLKLPHVRWALDRCSPSQQALVRARASGRRAQKSRKRDYNVNGRNWVQPLAFTRCRPCELLRLCAAYACAYRSHGYCPPPSRADGSGAWATVPFLLWPRPAPVSRMRRKIFEPLLPPPSVRRLLRRCPSRGSSVCTSGPSRNGTARCVPVERSSLHSSNECTATRAPDRG